MKKTITPFRNEQAAKNAEVEAAMNTMRQLTTSALLAAMENILRVLAERGQEVRDFDHKEKVVQQIRLVGGTPYILAARPEENVGEYISELQKAQESIRTLSAHNMRLLEENRKLKGGH